MAIRVFDKGSRQGETGIEKGEEGSDKDIEKVVKKGGRRRRYSGSGRKEVAIGGRIRRKERRGRAVGQKVQVWGGHTKLANIVISRGGVRKQREGLQGDTAEGGNKYSETTDRNGNVMNVVWEKSASVEKSCGNVDIAGGRTQYGRSGGGRGVYVETVLVQFSGIEGAVERRHGAETENVAGVSAKESEKARIHWGRTEDRDIIA